MPYFSLYDLTAPLLSSFAMKTNGCLVSPAVFLGLPQHKRREENLEKGEENPNGMPQAITALRVTCANPLLGVWLKNDQWTMCFSIQKKYLLLSRTGGQIHPLMSVTKSPKSVISMVQKPSDHVKRGQLSSQRGKGREWGWSFILLTFP